MNDLPHLSQPAMGLPVPDEVRMLPCRSAPQFDPRPVRRLYHRLPPHEADDLICRFLEDIALRLDQLQAGMATRALDRMGPPARRIALAARQMGLIEVAEAAQHVSHCLTQHDGVALQAVMARLERAFDVAVNEVWNLPEM